MLFNSAGGDAEQPVCICADGSVIARSRCLRPMLERQLSTFAAGELGLHSVITTPAEAPSSAPPPRLC